MNNKQLVKLAKIIDELDANNYHLEAFILRVELTPDELIYFNLKYCAKKAAVSQKRHLLFYI